MMQLISQTNSIFPLNNLKNCNNPDYPFVNGMSFTIPRQTPTQLAAQAVLFQPNLIHDSKISKKITPIGKDSSSTPIQDQDIDEDVSEEFVKNFNTHFGNNSNPKKAARLIEKMRRLGGLMPPLESESIDIPAARLGLSILAGLNKLTYKLQSLENLIVLLQNDKIEKETSIGLVTLAINLMTQMNRVLMQSETVDVQIKISEAYSIVAELLQRHYSKKHINGITKELKLELIETIKALEALNTQENDQLDFYVHLALEGVKRLIDDRKELFDLIERFYHLAAAIISLERYDAGTCFLELSRAFKDLDPNIPNAWYNGVLILKDLAKDAKGDINKLIGIQTLVREKYKQFDWKFAYAAIGIFHDIALHGQTKNIRKLAFFGIKLFGPDFPGLITFVDSQHLPKKIDLHPLIHFKKPIKRDPNIQIRYASIEYLISIANEALDSDLRKKAKTTLLSRLSLEKNPTILKLIEEAIPKEPIKQRKWLSENGQEKQHIVWLHRKKSSSS